MSNERTIALADLLAAVQLSSVRRQTLKGSAAARGAHFP